MARGKAVETIETGLRLPVDVHREAVEIAGREERSLNAQIVKWVREGIDRARSQKQEMQ